MEEYERFIKGLEQFGPFKFDRIGEYVGNRTEEQCFAQYSAYLRHLATAEEDVLADNVGKWSKDEELALTIGWRVYGNAWNKISKHIPGKSDQQCREKHSVVFMKRRNRFSAEEDQKLLEIVKDIGPGKWAKVASIMGGMRTDNQVYRRWVEVADPIDVQEFKDTYQNKAKRSAAAKRRKTLLT